MKQGHLRLAAWAAVGATMLALAASPLGAQQQTAMPVRSATFYTPTATIADGQTVSGAVIANGMMLVGFQTDANFDGSTITLQAAADGATYVAIKDPTTNAATSFTVGASGYYTVNPPLFVGPSLKIVSGTAQIGATSIIAVLAP